MTEPTYSELNYRAAPLPLIEINPMVGNAQIDQKYTIDRALAQVLNPIGVNFQSSIQRHPQAQAQTSQDSDQTFLQSPKSIFQDLEYRLWVTCSSQKSLDYQLLAEPLAKTIRSLDLQGFQDAIIQFTKSGAQVTDWRLRVDLAPPTIMLKDWARWGDVQAIIKLLNFALAPVEIQVSAVLKNLTLHIFCTLKNTNSAKFPTKKIVLDTIAPLLIELTPQGIQGATIYGLKSAQGSQVAASPIWTHWLDLPALGDPIYSPTPLMLAERGDLDALKFVLHRFLNPDLEQCFEVGGIKLSLLSRRRLLHVMSEAPICPLQSQVAAPVVKILTQLALPSISGLRIHGRIAGQSKPLWTYGVDFDGGPLILPPAAPEEVFVPDPSITKIGVTQRISQYLTATRIWQPQLTATKTSQLVHQRGFQWQASLLLPLLGLGLAMGGDFGLTAFMADTQLSATSLSSAPSQLSFNNALLEQKLAQYQLQWVQHGAPDVLIVGSSRALRGIDPAVLQRSLGSADLKIYNFGINGATAQVVDLVLRQLLTAQQLPKLVIWADGARAFNSGRADRTYETIALSDRYRQLALMSGRGNHSSSILQAQSSFKNSYQAIDSTVDLQLAQVSPAYHHRNRLKTWLQAQVPFVDRIVDSSGAIVANLSPTTPEPQIDANGFLSLDVKFDPDTYYQEHPKVTGDSDGDYANFQLLGSQHQALQQVTNLLSTQKIPLVFVNIPVSDIYLDQFRQEREIAFKNYMQQFVELDRLTFIDMHGLLNNQYDRFSDPSHLNHLGASEVSRYLAQSTMIPWSTSMSNPIVNRK